MPGESFACLILIPAPPQRVRNTIPGGAFILDILANGSVTCRSEAKRRKSSDCSGVDLQRNYLKNISLWVFLSLFVNPRQRWTVALNPNLKVKSTSYLELYEGIKTLRMAASFVEKIAFAPQSLPSVRVGLEAAGARLVASLQRAGGVRSVAVCAGMLQRRRRRGGLMRGFRAFVVMAKRKAFRTARRCRMRRKVVALWTGAIVAAARLRSAMAAAQRKRDERAAWRGFASWRLFAAMLKLASASIARTSYALMAPQRDAEADALALAAVRARVEGLTRQRSSGVSERLEGEVREVTPRAAWADGWSRRFRCARRWRRGSGR